MSISLDSTGQEIFKGALRIMVEAIENILGKQGIRADEVDLLALHQTNIRMIYVAGIVHWEESISLVGQRSADIPPYEGTVFDLKTESFAHYGVKTSHLLNSGVQAENS